MGREQLISRLLAILRGDLHCDLLQRILSGAQPGPGRQQRALLPQFLIREAVDDRNDPVSSKQRRQFLVRDAFGSEALQKYWA